MERKNLSSLRGKKLQLVCIDDSPNGPVAVFCEGHTSRLSILLDDLFDEQGNRFYNDWPLDEEAF